MSRHITRVTPIIYFGKKNSEIFNTSGERMFLRGSELAANDSIGKMDHCCRPLTNFPARGHPTLGRRYERVGGRALASATNPPALSRSLAAQHS
ncbi:MAG TPA: hypothetical protein VGJ20_12755 [Xanthobacteraceae bacterium]